MPLENQIEVIFIVLLLCESWSDFQTHECPDLYHLLVLSLSILRSGNDKWVDSMLNGIIPALVFIFPSFFSKQGMGGADIKLAFCLGALLTWKNALISLCMGIILAVLYNRKENHTKAIPLIPYLSMGTVVYLLSEKLYLSH